MNKNLILKIIGIVSALIFTLGALLPIASLDILGTKISKSLIDNYDWILVAVDAVLIIINLLLKEEVSLDICAATAVLITMEELKPFFDGSFGVAAAFVTKGIGFYCLIIGTVIIAVVAIAQWFIPSPDSKKKKGKEPETKKCPYCAEIIKAEAIKCRYCGSKLDQIEEKTEDESEELDVDEKIEAVAKSAGRVFLKVVLIIVSSLLFGICLLGPELFPANEQSDDQSSNSLISNGLFNFGNTESQSSVPETTASTTATTTTHATTTTPATTTTVTTTTAATEPEPEESEYDFELVYYLVQNNFEMVEPDIKSYVAIFDDGTFIYGSSDYYKITEYYGTWEPVRGPMGYETMLCTIEANENQVSYPYGTYQFTLSMSADDPQTAHFSITGDYNSDIFVYNHDGDTFMNIS